MTDLLRAALDHGAATAVPADRVLPAVLTGGRRRRLRRRIAAGGAVAVAVAAAVVVVPAVIPERPAGIPAASAPSTALVPAPDNPPSAVFDVDLIPPGWTYIGGGTAAALYAGPGQPTTDDADFVGRLAVFLQKREEVYPPRPTSAWPFRVNGQPVFINRANDDTVSVYVDPGTGPYVVAQVPRSIGLSDEDLVRLVGSVSPRETAQVGNG